MKTVSETIREKVQQLKNNQKGLCNICLDISDCPMLDGDGDVDIMEVTTLGLWSSGPIEFNDKGVGWCPMFALDFDKEGDPGAGARGNDKL